MVLGRPSRARGSDPAQKLDARAKMRVARHDAGEAAIGGHQRGIAQQRRRQIEAIIDRIVEGDGKLQGAGMELLDWNQDVKWQERRPKRGDGVGRRDLSAPYSLPDRTANLGRNERGRDQARGCSPDEARIP